WPWPSADEDPVEALAVVTSHPRWLVRRWVERFGIEEAKALCEANNETPPLHIRTNTLKIQRGALAEMLEAAGAEVALGPLAPEALHVRGLGSVPESPAFRAGLFTVQDEGAQLVSRALAPEPGQRVIDLCGARRQNDAPGRADAKPGRDRRRRRARKQAEAGAGKRGASGHRHH